MVVLSAFNILILFLFADGSVSTTKIDDVMVEEKDAHT